MNMDTNLLADAVNGVILSSSNQNQMMPSWVADEAYKTLDSDLIAPTPVRYGCTEHLKQIARKILRGKFEPDNDANADQHELWPNLQTRYPTAKKASDGEPVYVKVEYLSDTDIQWNVNRLLAESDTKAKHAAALRQFGIDRRSRAA